MSTRASYAGDFDACPGWHLYRELSEPGEPLYLDLHYAGGARVLWRLPPAFVAALQGTTATVGEVDDAS